MSAASDKLAALRRARVWLAFEGAIRDQLFLYGLSPSIQGAELLHALAAFRAGKDAKEAALAIKLARELGQA
jgi:hypothetical protein